MLALYEPVLRFITARWRALFVFDSFVVPGLLFSSSLSTYALYLGREPLFGPDGVGLVWVFPPTILNVLATLIIALAISGNLLTLWNKKIGWFLAAAGLFFALVHITCLGLFAVQDIARELDFHRQSGPTGVDPGDYIGVYYLQLGLELMRLLYNGAYYLALRAARTAPGTAEVPQNV
jgi:hypothetical protein